MVAPILFALANAAKALPGARIDRIIAAFAEVTGTRVEDMAGPSQTAAISHHRHQLMFVIRKLVVAASYAEIGAHLGNRHWTTVQEAVQKTEATALELGDVAAYLTRLVDMVQAKLADNSPAAPNPWQITAAASVLRDDALTDTEARKAALTFLIQLEGSHAG